MKTIYCPSCGAEILLVFDDGFSHCSVCGAEIEEPEPEEKNYDNYKSS